jgi:hypothetical protein
MTRKSAADFLRGEIDFLWGGFRRDVEAIRDSAKAEAEQEYAAGGRWRNPNETRKQLQVAIVMRCCAMIDNLSQHVRGGKAWDKQYRSRVDKLEKRANKRGTPLPNYPSPQTYRMARFIQHYLGVHATAARLAIEIYRHMLMHEGFLHGVIDGQDRQYQWYLGWDADGAHHFRLRRLIAGQTPDVVAAVEARLENRSLGTETPDYIAEAADALIAEYGEEELNNTWLVEIGTMTLVEDVERAAHAYIADLRGSTALHAAYLRLRDERWNDKLKWTPVS